MNDTTAIPDAGPLAEVAAHFAAIGCHAQAIAEHVAAIEPHAPAELIAPLRQCAEAAVNLANTILAAIAPPPAGTAVH